MFAMRPSYGSVCFLKWWLLISGVLLMELDLARLAMTPWNPLFVAA